MGKIKILIAILIIAAAAFFFLNAQNQNGNCENSQNQADCYSKLAIAKSDETICQNLSGVKKDECLFNVDIVKTSDVCDTVNEEFDDRLLDICAIKFPERFAKIDCGSLVNPDLIEYCRQKQAGK